MSESAAAAVGQVEEAARWLRHAQRILVFTGAGISTESGIPDYRGPNGLWKRQDPSRYTIDRYLAEPEVRRERWRDRLRSPINEAQPNAAHHAVTRLQRGGRAPDVVTQNIDGLHQAAGTVDVIELHGTTRQAVCLTCDRRIPVEQVLERVAEGDDDPHCELCGGILKTATISFGQTLVDDDVSAATAAARRCDACLVVGSTCAVWPAAGIVNQGETQIDSMSDALVSGNAATVLPRLVDAVLR
jgi:NAD-dependent deacetylase